jgi:hypothetical protein
MGVRAYTLDLNEAEALLFILQVKEGATVNALIR